jgi:cytochrome c553
MMGPNGHFTLRQLPFPAKLVLTCFLLAVGGGYLAAMIQVHVQDSKSGKAMPTLEDVILKYTGKKWFASEADVPRPTSQFVKLITAAEDGLPFNGIGTMSPAFFNKCPEFTRISRAGESQRQRIRAERSGERDVLVLWAESDPEIRQRAYLDDNFGVEPNKMPPAITSEFKSTDGAIKVKSIIEARCTRCHKPDGDDTKAANFPLVSYADIEKYLAVTSSKPFRSGGDWIQVQEPISLEKLTQSTHAHLLSFSVLFSLTGLIVAFTSYPSIVRCLLGPLVLLAVVADVSLWWLARQSTEWGPYFAMGIIGTGGLAGVGLAVQITLSLFNMYGPRGKLMIILIFGLVAVISGLVYLNQIKPALDAKEQRLLGSSEPGKRSHPSARNEGTEPSRLPRPAMEAATMATRLAWQILHADSTQTTTASKENRLQQVLRFPLKRQDGTDYPVLEMPFKNPPEKNMVRAFFDQDGNIFKKVTDPTARLALLNERHNELAAVLAWSKLPDPERRKTFEADAFPLPPELNGKPFTADYLKGGKIHINALITDRCIRCHADEQKAEFSDYDGLLKYLK